MTVIFIQILAFLLMCLYNVYVDREEEIMNDIFGCPMWHNKYKISWCDQCDVATIQCPRCKNSSCSGGGCEECKNDPLAHEFFEKAKTHIEAYLTEDEKVVYEKARWIKKYIKTSLARNENEIDWNKIKDTEMCERSCELLKDFLNEKQS
jgi:hypothetical protein